MEKQETKQVNQTCQLWDAKTFGQRLSLSKRQIFRLNSFGKIPAPFKIGGSIRWDSGEISEWIASGCPDRKTWEQMKQTREISNES